MQILGTCLGKIHKSYNYKMSADTVSMLGIQIVNIINNNKINLLLRLKDWNLCIIKELFIGI